MNRQKNRYYSVFFPNEYMEWGNPNFQLKQDVLNKKMYIWISVQFYPWLHMLFDHTKEKSVKYSYHSSPCRMNRIDFNWDLPAIVKNLYMKFDWILCLLWVHFPMTQSGKWNKNHYRSTPFLLNISNCKQDLLSRVKNIYVKFGAIMCFVNFLVIQ